ncbi:MAG: hypothetical protein JWM71_1874, partial [Solirubrobacteraceae bacterium]|nr:hypothetical protein [Solirubrobacteraceae bacterium]
SHVAVGLNEEGRWLQVDIQHSSLTESFHLAQLVVTAVVTNDDPEVR